MPSRFSRRPVLYLTKCTSFSITVRTLHVFVGLPSPVTKKTFKLFCSHFKTRITGESTARADQLLNNTRWSHRFGCFTRLRTATTMPCWSSTERRQWMLSSNIAPHSIEVIRPEVRLCNRLTLFQDWRCALGKLRQKFDYC